MTSYSYPKLRT